MAAPAKKEWDQWGAWVWIKWKQGAPHDAWKAWDTVPGIKEAWSTTGKWDFAVWVDAANPKDIEQIVWKDIRGNKWVEHTDTHWAKKCW